MRDTPRVTPEHVRRGEVSSGQQQADGRMGGTEDLPGAKHGPRSLGSPWPPAAQRHGPEENGQARGEAALSERVLMS